MLGLTWNVTMVPTIPTLLPAILSGVSRKTGSSSPGGQDTPDSLTIAMIELMKLVSTYHISPYFCQNAETNIEDLEARRLLREALNVIYI